MAWQQMVLVAWLLAWAAVTTSDVGKQQVITPALAARRICIGAMLAILVLTI